MSIMELIVKVLKIKRRELITFLINNLVILVFYQLLFEDSEILYPLILSIFIILVYFIIEVIRYKRFKEKLQDSKRSPDYNNSDVDTIEEETLNVISDIHKHYLNAINTLNHNISDRDSLFSQWIHNMKTSITVIDLACEKSILNDKDSKCIDDIKEENKVLKKNLEECLNMLRLDDFSRDYITYLCNLEKLINDIVNSKKRDFIYKGVFPKVDIDENINIYTDRKWCGYMLEQIISNAIKYSKNNKCSSIEIQAIENDNIVELLIRDKGVGITKEDLPRVFDPFFTGKNGRKERSSTGIGLYMVKLIAEKLGHIIEVKSKVLVGTEVKIIFSNQRLFE